MNRTNRFESGYSHKYFDWVAPVCSDVAGAFLGGGMGAGFGNVPTFEFRFKNGAIPTDSSLSPSKQAVTLQFQNGAIPRLAQIAHRQEPICFNSKMVRFQGPYSAGDERNSPYFNSKMVRFQEQQARKGVLIKYVPIPKWCDSKVKHSFFRNLFSVFQFQNGAIPRNFLELYPHYQTWVSIPKWCDSKFLTGHTLHVGSEFQFQNGAIPR